MRKWPSLILLLFILLLLVTGCRGKKNVTPVPERQGFVNDYASVLTSDETAALTSSLQTYEKESCHQIFILTVPSLLGEPISEFSTRTATIWDIGQETLKNGVLLTVAMEEGSIRIEAASGLDFIVTDGVGEQILQKKMLPLFREGKISEGIRTGTEALMEAARRTTYPENHRPSICL